MDVRMLRSDNKQERKDVLQLGYDGISTDINEGRGQSYLYLIWKTIDIGDSVVV